MTIEERKKKGEEKKLSTFFPLVSSGCDAISLTKEEFCA